MDNWNKFDNIMFSGLCHIFMFFSWAWDGITSFQFIDYSLMKSKKSK